MNTVISDRRLYMENIIEAYNKDEEYLYIKPYMYIKGYAVARQYENTLKALPLARHMHDGQYRKGTVNVGGKDVRLPYFLHVLKVCSTLINLDLKLPDKELDILFCSAICHDLLEDCHDKFPKGGIELVENYGIDGEVLDIVRLLSKHTGADEEELSEYFNAIKYNKLALLVKFSDRGHNVETLSCMKLDKIHKYVKETRDWIYPLCSYAKQNYPEITTGVTILKSKIAIETSISIMDAFVSMRKFISTNFLEQKHINNLVLEHNTTIMEHDNEIKLIQETLNKFEEKRKVTEIYYNGQIFDAYFKILEIFKTAKRSIIIIDNYADIKLLDIIKNLKVDVTVITRKNNLLKKEYIEEYNKQYHNLKVIYNSTFHDRYFILDESDVYHCGASINKIGYKTFSINEWEDEIVKKSFISRILKFL